ncbi:unnamed protein product [Caenorhabditis nigoni]
MRFELTRENPNGLALHLRPSDLLDRWMIDVIKERRVKIKVIDGLMYSFQLVVAPSGWIRRRRGGCIGDRDRINIEATTTVRCTQSNGKLWSLSSGCRGTSWKDSTVDKGRLVKKGRCCGVTVL